MNIEADALATNALRDGRSQPILPFDPSCGAMLSINGRAITRNIEATIQRHEHTDPIQQYYCKRFGWTEDTFTMIDWDIYAMVYFFRKGRNEHPRTPLLKPSVAFRTSAV